MRGKRVLICGSRTWDDWERIEEVVSILKDHGYQTIIAGGAKGADAWAERASRKFNMDLAIVRAQWWNYGNYAGRERNIQMLSLHPDRVLAFWDGKSPGTKMMRELARKDGVPVLTFYA